MSIAGTTSVTSGETSSGAVAPRYQEIVYSGGTTTGTVVSSGGAEIVASGGVALATSVRGGGYEYIYSGGTASGTILSGTAYAVAREYVYSGGTTTGTTVGSMGVEYVYSGAAASAALVRNGGLLLLGAPSVSGGVSVSATILSGGIENVSSGGAASGTVVSSGGTDNVAFSGAASGTVVSNGGAEEVNGVTSGTVVASGGHEDVFVNGVASGTVVSAGGFERISNGGTASGTQVQSGGVAFVYSGGTASGVNDAAGGIVVAVPGANVTGVTGSGTVISTGVLYDSAGTLVSTTAVSGLSLDGGGFSDQVTVLTGGTTTATSLADGAIETVYSGGSANGTIVSNGGQETVSSGGTALGTIVASGGTENIVGTASGTTVASGGEVQVFSGGTTSATTVSNGGTEYINFGGTASATSVLSGGVEYIEGGTATSTTFASGGELDLEAITFGSGETASIDGSALLTVTSGGSTLYSQQLAPADADDTANVTSDTNGDTLVTVTCFASGTAIRTTRGDVAVEALAVGDVAVTASGAHRWIRWLGHRTIDCRNHPHPNDVRPVRIAAHSFGEELPERDLYLSPGHPVLVGADENGGHLVPVMCLVNGTTVRRVAVDAVTYWHVELDAHDILLAEGLAAESYLDWGDRGFFTEGADHRLVNPDFVVPGLAARCRPVALDGPVVEAERRRLDMVFASRLAAACDWPAEHGAMTLL